MRHSDSYSNRDERTCEGLTGVSEKEGSDEREKEREQHDETTSTRCFCVHVVLSC